MKPTVTKADVEMFEYLNPDFHSFLRSYTKPGTLRSLSDKKPLSFKDIKKNKQAKAGFDILGGGAPAVAATEEGRPQSDYQEKLYYDYHSIDDMNFTGKPLSRDRKLKRCIEEELQDEPKPYFIWVHITCVQFIQELYFGDRTHLTNVYGRIRPRGLELTFGVGLEDIERDRFRHECDICNNKSKRSLYEKC